MPLPSQQYLPQPEPVVDPKRQLAQEALVSLPQFTRPPQPGTPAISAVAPPSPPAAPRTAQPAQDRFPSLEKAIASYRASSAPQSGAPVPISDVVGFTPAETPDYRTASQIPSESRIDRVSSEGEKPSAVAPYTGPPKEYKKIHDGEYPHKGNLKDKSADEKMKYMESVSKQKGGY